MGFLVSSALLLISSIPFWFLPRSLPKQGGDKGSCENPEGTEGTTFNNNHNLKLTEIAKGWDSRLHILITEQCWHLKVIDLVFHTFIVIACITTGCPSTGFLPSLKRLLGTPAYFLLLCGSILKFNSFIGLFTFKAKYMEQQFGQSASRANFLIGKKKKKLNIQRAGPLPHTVSQSGQTNENVHIFIATVGRVMRGTFI